MEQILCTTLSCITFIMKHTCKEIIHEQTFQNVYTSYLGKHNVKAITWSEPTYPAERPLLLEPDHFNNKNSATDNVKTTKDTFMTSVNG